MARSRIYKKSYRGVDYEIRRNDYDFGEKFAAWVSPFNPDFPEWDKVGTYVLKREAIEQAKLLIDVQFKLGHRASEQPKGKTEDV